MAEQPAEKTIRLDKWLKIARIFKTRTQASTACDEGKITVNDVVAKAAKMIKVGDTLAVKTRTSDRELKVLAIVFKSIAAAQARELYEDLRTDICTDETEELIRLMKQAKPPKPAYKGRPSKKDRRDLAKIRGY